MITLYIYRPRKMKHVVPGRDEVYLVVYAGDTCLGRYRARLQIPCVQLATCEIHTRSSRAEQVHRRAVGTFGKHQERCTVSGGSLVLEYV